MKFTNGYWMIRDGVDALYAREAYELAADATTAVSYTHLTLPTIYSV